ncbi:MAG: hypothetical protein C0592_14510 [Marinilabiliales bacterium]|nr:MAG: hypothetical protein C0592_14510 [Marinilabiliales bacterium]
MKKSLFLLLILLTTGLNAQEKPFTIPYELDSNKTMTYEEIVTMCHTVDSLFMEVRLKSFGTTSRGYDLPYLIVEDPMKRDKKLTLWIQAGIHPGESEGADAGFLFLRDVLTKPEFRVMLQKVRIIFIPVFNADGWNRMSPYNRINQNGPEEMGWRCTAQNLNLNRDFMKADAPAMQNWLKLFNEINPDFVVDCHTTDGADYQYALTYGLDTHEALNQDVAKWLNEKYVPLVEANMSQAGYPIYPYVAFREWHNPKSGLRTYASRPMLSHGYTILSDRPCLLIETHMLKPYNIRVESTRQMLLNTLIVLNTYNTEYHDVLQKADADRKSKEFAKSKFPIHFKTSMQDSSLTNFLGFDYDTLTSEITGGKYFVYHNDQPETFNLWIFNKIVIDREVDLPIAYVIPPEWSEVIYRLKLHGISIITVQEDTEVEATQTKFSNIEFPNRPYEGRFSPSFDAEEYETTIIVHKGSALVRVNQDKIKVIAWLLEPYSEDSFLKWGFFNTIFEQKEYGELYVMEPIAVEMFEKDPALEAEFEELKASNPQFAASQWAQMNWVYNHSLWADPQKDVYPVIKITKESEFQKLNPSR